MLIKNPEFISNSSIAILQGLIGKTIHTIFTPHLDAAGPHLAAPTLSMLASKDHFINFSCKWSETPQFLNDSWQITVAEHSDPLDIAQNASGALIDPCSISMYHATPIEKIEILEYSYAAEGEGAEEAVTYDQAILFHCADRSFCIACMLNGPGIAEYLHFSENVEVIQQMVSESTVRLVIE
jgi:hypothetical protein